MKRQLLNCLCIFAFTPSSSCSCALFFYSPAASAGLWLSAGEADDAAEHLGISTDTFDTRLAVVNLQVDDTGTTAFRRLAPAPRGRHILTAEGWVIDEEDSASAEPVVYSDQRYITIPSCVAFLHFDYA